MLPLCADQTWHAGGTPNVLNENLLISGECALSGNVTVSALTSNVTVTVTAFAAEHPIVRGSGKVLELITAADHEIIFSLTDSEDLAFEGGISFLRIIQRGTGTVRWLLNGGRTITFRNSTESGAFGGNGVQYFISMENVGQEIIIERGDSTALHAGFIILNNSLVTFVAPTLLGNNPTETGTIVFDTANTNSVGRTYVQLGTQAGLILSGHYVTHLADPTLVTVDLAQPAGLQVNSSITETVDAYTSLLLINGNTILPQLYCDPTRTGVYTGAQSGFILGTNSNLFLENNTYLDYVGTTTNVPPLTSTSAVLNGRMPQTVLKNRNASAFIIDGAPSGTAGAVDACITITGDSGIFLRSGADKNGGVTAQVDTGFSFTISPTAQLVGAGNIVFDIEASCTILGSGSGTDVINVLSREVAPTGGYIEIDEGDPVFPRITFARDAHYPAYYAQYAKACCFINNRANLSHVTIRHDDYFHVVNAVNTPYNSEPTYVGGDTFKLVQTTTIARPKIVMHNSSINVHTSAACTGFDFFVTNTNVLQANNSYIRYYQNGYVVDKGSGRALILGTNPGSYAYDYATVVDNKSHLDIYQEVNQTAGYDQKLSLVTAANNNTVIEGVPSDISTQYSIHTLFLGNASTVQVGTQSPAPAGLTLTTLPKFYLNGNFLSIMSQGGIVGQPALSATTGQGGVFVDINGTVQAASTVRAHFGAMVVQGDESSIIDLPKARIDFETQVGIAYWRLDLAQTQIVVPALQTLSDFTIDWMSVKKDYAGGFVPFVPIGAIGSTINAANLYHIPVVNGQLDRLLVKRARVGDPFNIKVDGGRVRELTFLKGFDSSEAFNGVVVVTNNGRIGIGNSQTARESAQAAVVLGVNGVTLVPDGNGTIDLNANIEVNSVCHILAGPNFGVSEAQELHINADTPIELRIKKGGVLDLSSFTSDNQRVVFCGQAQVLFEPGSKLLLGGGTVWFTNDSRLRIENEIKDNPPIGTSVASTDDFRVPFIGTGTLIFDENSSLQVEKDSYLGIEWQDVLAGITATNFLISVRDSASIKIGNDALWGGSFQIGNITHKTGAVSVTIELDGAGAIFETNSQGFWGVGAGIVDKHASIPNSWRVGSLYDVDQFKLHIIQGNIRHNNVSAGDSDLAGLWVFGPATKYYLDIESYSTFHALGGGNLYRIDAGVTWVNPIVLDTASNIVGISASLPLLKDRNNKDLIHQMELVGGTAQDFFNVLRTKDVLTMTASMANFAQVALEDNRLGYLFGTTINRQRWTRILDTSGNRVAPEHSLFMGAVAISIERSTGMITNVVQIIR
jgi:hypothetical protein